MRSHGEESNFGRLMTCDSRGQQFSESIGGLYYWFVVLALSLSCHWSKCQAWENLNAFPIRKTQKCYALLTLEELQHQILCFFLAKTPGEYKIASYPSAILQNI
jgi:hypothetical protein